MGKPPSDLADHAEDFSHRWADKLDELAGVRMDDLGIPKDKIGSRIPGRGHATFIPDERTGGGNDALGGLTVDSGIFNPGLLSTLRGSEQWAKARVRDRMDAIIAHEHEEARRGTHEDALEHAPNTHLPISEQARHILLAMKGQRKQ
jgi:hypothetical protein